MYKKYSNAVLMMAVAVLSCFSLSCGKDDVTKIKTDNSFAIALLVDDTVNSCDILDEIDPEWNKTIFIDENDELYYVYVSDTLKDVISGRKLLGEVEDIDINVSEMIRFPEIEIPEEVYAIRDIIASGAVPPVSYEYKIDTTLMIPDFPGLPFAVEFFSINKTMLREGFLNLNISAEGIDDNVLQCQFVLTSADIVTEGGTFEITAVNHENVSVNMKDCTITPDNGVLGLNSCVRIMVPSVIFGPNTTLDQIDGYIQAVEMIGGRHNVSMNGKFGNVKLKFVEGILNIPYVRYGNVVEDLDFSLGSLTGDLNVNTPDVLVKYVNSFGFGTHAAIDTMTLRTKQGDDIDVMKTDEISFNVDQSSSYNQLDISGEVIDYIDVMQDYDKFIYSGRLSVINEDAVGVYEDSHIDIATVINVKLGMKINELIYIDTLDVDFSDMNDDVTVMENVDEVDFKFALKNNLPFAVDFQAYLLKNGNITDSLFDASNSLITSSYGHGPVEKENVVVITDERLDKLVEADHLMYRCKAMTSGREVVLKSTDFIVIGIGLMTKTTEVDIDDLL